MVTHGGLGSVKECIAHGVPMVVVPLAVDQHDNAARVEYHGIGMRTRLAAAGSGELFAVIERLLHDEGARRRIERMREHFARTERATRGADIVEQQLPRPRCSLSCH
jgi:UDP:flavonoid glycosyltransferase YjiC (YdhE family)